MYASHEVNITVLTACVSAFIAAFVREVVML